MRPHARGCSLITLALAAAVLGAAPPAGACDSSACQLVTRGQSGLLPRGALRVDLSFRQTDETRLMRGSDTTDLVLRPKIDFENRRLTPGYHDELGGTSRFLQLDLAYGLGARTSLLASIPLVARRSFDIGHPPVLRETYETTGNGDAVLGVRRALLAGPTASLVAGLSIETPTGRHRLTSPPGRADSGILDPSLQPGSGSTNFVTSALFSRQAPSLGVEWSLSGSYQINTKNDLDYRLGDTAIASATVRRRLLDRLQASLQVKGVRIARSRYLGESVPSTGSKMLYLVPGLSLGPFQKTSVYGFLTLPTYRYVNETQLAPKLGFLVGVSRIFSF